MRPKSIAELLDASVHTLVRRGWPLSIIGITFFALPSFIVSMASIGKQPLLPAGTGTAVLVLTSVIGYGAFVKALTARSETEVDIPSAVACGSRCAARILWLYVPLGVSFVVACAVLSAPGIVLLLVFHLAARPADRIVQLLVYFGPSLVVFVIFAMLVSLTFYVAIGEVVRGAKPREARKAACRLVLAAHRLRRSILVSLCAFAPQVVLLSATFLWEIPGLGFPTWITYGASAILMVPANGFFITLSLLYGDDLRLRDEGLDLLTAADSLAIAATS